jgi:hypothetical protein
MSDLKVPPKEEGGEEYRLKPVLQVLGAAAPEEQEEDADED